ncbi:aldehyde ferredoxin oxidoreductase C-terminal domain-containing protein [Thermus thermamylovorans]|uniref:Aldehyde ferredoxin oxidoreductase n=1 Tax=Thermus thermamylovorans TaxID=2509362 RepID=A0A4Q9B767_9DEIN|nr:aldehyde ferredoxin oxidoreductase C-terminal domain-containing protein [Thermus thermamylovorans]TBH20942.1 aldehyde ferredoxin oxidoreductase [Thermus thermamylovorans]
MWRSLRLDLSAHKAYWQAVAPEEVAYGGRYRTGQLLLEREAWRFDPLSPENPLAFAIGPLAGTGFSNANRTSVGARSPLTLGIKEANGGGTFGYALGQMRLSHLLLEGASPGWVVLRITREGQVFFDPAEDLLGLGNFEAARKLFAAYGRRIAFALLGPVGEYGGLLSGIAFSDTDGRPSRLAARGGVGAVMGAKRVKAIVVEVPGKAEVWDKPKVTGAVRRYAELLRQDPLVMQFYNAIGTMGMADFQNAFGGLPVRNFREGRLAPPEDFRMGGQHIAPLNRARGGKHTHACMPGCVIGCSNVIVDERGEEVVSPLEYETIGLLGTNCGLTDPDQLARLNRLANDLGVDTIETGATLALFMEKGEADWGDYAFMEARLKALYTPSEEARFLAQGAARVGEALGLKRVPVIKRQAISAYDPRVVEATGITMMVTAQGADHTAGNAPRLETRAMPVEEILEASYQAQVNAAANDALGLCVFGGSVTNKQVAFIAESVNAALGTNLSPSFWHGLGEGVLRLEHRFNHLAGFSHEDDRLPRFFYEEPVPPKGHTARFRPEDLSLLYDRLHQGS